MLPDAVARLQRVATPTTLTLQRQEANTVTDPLRCLVKIEFARTKVLIFDDILRDFLHVLFLCNTTANQDSVDELFSCVLTECDPQFFVKKRK